MFVVSLHLSFDQIFHELWKGRVRISFTPLPSCCHRDFSAVFPKEILLHPCARLELVPVGGHNPGEGVAGDDQGGAVLELLDVSQSPSPDPEDLVQREGALVIAGIPNVGNKEPG